MQNPPMPAFPTSTPCRTLLAAIADALSIAPPATARDEVTYLRLSRDRARLAIWACRTVLDRGDDDAGLQSAANRLREQVVQHPDDGYDHSPLSS